jgi:hypothetical protein
MERTSAARGDILPAEHHPANGPLMERTSAARGDNPDLAAVPRAFREFFALQERVKRLGVA